VKASLAPSDRHYDVIVAGSGPGGATVAREMTKLGHSVLLLERGTMKQPRDSLFYFAPIIDTAPVADGVDFARAIGVGGTTNLYFGSAEYPVEGQFEAIGIHMATAMAETRAELPIVEPAPDHCISDQVRAVSNAARALGMPWVRTEAMAIDEAKVGQGCDYDAVWRAGSFVNDALAGGAVLETRARVIRVLVENGRAIGVEYEHRIGRRSILRRAHAAQIVIATGALATPGILRASGINGVAEHGFYCDPGFLVTGHVKGLNGGDVIPGCMGTNLDDDGLLVGDGCVPRTLWHGMQLANRNWRGFFRHRSHVAVGVLARDSRSGQLDEDGRFHKNFTGDEIKKLAKGESIARQILHQAGATDIIRSPLSSAHLGGTVAIGEVVDDSLETSVSGCFVCDNSILPPSIRLAPMFSLVSLAKYLSKILDKRI
jgi:choline dehydrogenase-like flavoprotein